mgnify:CR=1 FL=1
MRMRRPTKPWSPGPSFAAALAALAALSSSGVGCRSLASRDRCCCCCCCAFFPFGPGMAFFLPLPLLFFGAAAASAAAAGGGEGEGDGEGERGRFLVGPALAAALVGVAGVVLAAVFPAGASPLPPFFPTLPPPPPPPPPSPPPPSELPRRLLEGTAAAAAMLLASRLAWALVLNMLFPLLFLFFFFDFLPRRASQKKGSEATRLLRDRPHLGRRKGRGVEGNQRSSSLPLLFFSQDDRGLHPGAPESARLRARGLPRQRRVQRGRRRTRG